MKLVIVGAIQGEDIVKQYGGCLEKGYFYVIVELKDVAVRLIQLHGRKLNTGF